jgi:hypothetical protein
MVFVLHRVGQVGAERGPVLFPAGQQDVAGDAGTALARRGDLRLVVGQLPRAAPVVVSNQSRGARPDSSSGPTRLCRTRSMSANGRPAHGTGPSSHASAALPCGSSRFSGSAASDARASHPLPDRFGLGLDVVVFPDQECPDS